jgi:hypothetical protein
MKIFEKERLKEVDNRLMISKEQLENFDIRIPEEGTFVSSFDKEKHDGKDVYINYYFGDDTPKSAKEMCWSKMIWSRYGFVIYVSSLPENPSDKFKSNIDTALSATAAYAGGLVGIVAKNVVKGLMGGFDKKDESEESINLRKELSVFIPTIDIVAMDKVKVSTGMFSSMTLLKITAENSKGDRNIYWLGKLNMGFGDETDFAKFEIFDDDLYLDLINVVEEESKAFAKQK